MYSFLASASVGEWMDKTFLGFELGVFRFFGQIGSEFLNVAAKIFSNFGTVKYGALLLVLALVLVFFKKTRKYGMALIISVLLGLLITNGIIKPLFLRVRPYNTLQYIPEFMGWYFNAGMLAESDFCFPSGHTTAAFEVAIAMFLCFRADGRKKFAWIFPVIAVLTGLSRIYLMVHYATDVIAGVIIGILAGIVGYNISRLITNKFSQSESWQRFDLERVIRKKTGRKISKKAACWTIFIAWLVIFGVTVVFSLKEGGDSLRCAYDDKYNCYNEVKEKDEYLIDGEYYCKIHTKELTEQQTQQQTEQQTQQQTEQQTE